MNFNLKLHNESLAVFKELDNAFPNNDKYKGWIYLIRSKKLDIFSWVSTGLMLLMLIINIFFKGKIPLFDKFSFWLMLLSLVFFLTIEVIKWFLKHKKKK